MLSNYYLNYRIKCNYYPKGRKMTRDELAKKFNVSLKTLHNWEKEKPELIRIINLGLLADTQIEETRNHLEKLEDMQKNAENGKLL